MRYPFDSPQAEELNKKIFETIYFGALTSSCELAAKYGPYDTYQGSPVSQGVSLSLGEAMTTLGTCAYDFCDFMTCMNCRHTLVHCNYFPGSTISHVHVRFCVMPARKECCGCVVPILSWIWWEKCIL